MDADTHAERVSPDVTEFSILYFQHLQNRFGKMRVHARHTVHALPDLLVAAGRLRDGVSFPHLMAEAKRRAVLLTIYKKPLYTSLL